MSSPATTQDVQNAFERTKGALMGNMLTRDDLRSVVQQVRIGLLQDLHTLHAENKTAIRQASVHRDQILQRIGSVEAGVARLEQNMQAIMSQQSKTTSRIGKMGVESGYLFQRI